MTGIFIVLLVGVAGLLIGLGFFIMLALRFGKTLGEVETTLSLVSEEIRDIAPGMNAALRQLEKTGQDIGKTTEASTALLNRFNGISASSPALDGAARFLPAAIGLVKLAGPLLSGRRKKRRGS